MQPLISRMAIVSLYILPLSHDRLLIEDTYYINKPALLKTQVRHYISYYVHKHLWKLEWLICEEHGSLHIALNGNIDDFWKKQYGQPCSSLHAGLFHSTTGYSLPVAIVLAECVV